ncbi:MAG: hypothetical protein ACYCW6_32425, partial [Candidatus Xenobia bacterium]
MRISSRLMALLAILLMLVAGSWCFADDEAPLPSVAAVKGAWISPDWLFPGPQQYTEQQVRQAAQQTMDEVRKQGINEIFLETMLRGTTICAYTQRNTDGSVSIMDDATHHVPYPMYRPLKFTDMRMENGVPMDTLQIFIDEGRKVGVKVHAWCHMFYWHMDNSDVVPSWKEGRTAWDDLLMGWLRKEHDLLAAKGAETAALVTALDQARAIVLRGYNGSLMDQVLEAAHIPNQHNPLGSLVKAVMAAGGDSPDFLLIWTPDDPFPAPKRHVLRSVFVDPENSRVQARIYSEVSNIVQSHPGLAGVMLDHIRYPTGPMG